MAVNAALDSFKCRRCGACCRIPGGIVRLTDGDVDAIAAFLGLGAAEFAALHTEVAPDRKCLILKDAADGACAMLDADGACRIQPVKPAQCREFPHSWTNADSAEYCPALRELAGGAE